MTLRTWLHHLRQRGGRLVATNGVIVVHDTTHRWDDHLTIQRHRHALTVAATGDHPAWWAYVTGRTDQPPDPDQIPWADDGFACATCGQAAAHLDATLLPFCDDHWTADPTQEVAA